MAVKSDDNLTMLIVASRAGDTTARERLFELVYEELRQIARRSRFAGADGDTLQPTALANEAYLLFHDRFPCAPCDDRENRETFFRTVALAMRTILRDYWRKKNAAKRGGGAQPFRFDRGDPPDPSCDNEFKSIDFLQLDEAIDRLRLYNERWHDVVMHRYFAGRTIEETAGLMGIGTTAVKTEWRLARAWLRRELGE